MTRAARRAPERSTLEADGPRALAAIRSTITRVLGELPPAARAVQLGECLAIDRSLAWKIWRVARGPDELPSPKHIPGRSGMTLFLDAAARRGASPTSVARVFAALERLEAVVASHAGDRADAEILLGRFTGEGRRRLELQLRRQGYRANCHFLGVGARVRHQLDVLLPREAGHMPAVARVRGYYGLKRTRADARWVLMRGFVVLESGRPGYRRTALAGGESDPEHRVPLIPPFCSAGDLPVRREVKDGRTYVDELLPGPMGRAGETDVVTGELISDVPARDVTRDVLGVHVRTPAERFCYDVLVHRDLATLGGPEMETYSTLNGGDVDASPDPRDRVDLGETLREIEGPATLHPSPAVPRHAELIHWTLAALGRSAEEFRAYRLEVRFPPVAIVVRVSYPIVG